MTSSPNDGQWPWRHVVISGSESTWSEQFPHETALADPGLTDEKGELGRPCADDLIEHGCEVVELDRAADERSQVGGVRIDPAS